MSNNHKTNINKIQTGFIPGMILPVIIFILLYFASGMKVSFGSYLQGMWHLQMLMKLLALCVTPNLVLFLYFFRKKHDLAARGVLMATFVYAFIVVISKSI